MLDNIALYQPRNLPWFSINVVITPMCSDTDEEDENDIDTVGN